jgi:acid phosphatase type 7
MRLVTSLVCACLALAALPAAAAADPVVFAAGDIACDPLDVEFNAGDGTATACRQKATSDAILANGADAVLALGDLQYDAASLQNFLASYNLSWGRLKAKTFPVIGNHEGVTPTTGAGYCKYFGAAAHCNAGQTQGGAAFYSFDLGAWHVVVLNSNCDAAGGCAAGSPQYQWLAADLAANPRACTLAAWHHPRWSSGHDGNNDFMQPIWALLAASGAELVLSGHSHDYERFAPLGATGALDPAYGMRQFVVGTGGAHFTGLGNSGVAGSEVRQNTAFGVLRLDLHPTGYAWSFVPAAGGSFSDSGSQACHDPAPVAPPAAPAPPTTGSGGASVRRFGKLLAHWRLGPRTARRSLALGRVRIGRRRWHHTVIRVRVGGRLAARREVTTKRVVKVRLAAWSHKPRYRGRRVTVTVRRPFRA